MIKTIRTAVTDTFQICGEEIRHAFRDEGVLIFLFVVPLLYPLLYSWIYNNEVVREVPVAVVDLSHSHESREYLRMFDASPDTRVAYYCNNLAEAQDLIGRQKVYGILYFPHDYGTKINRGEQVHIGVYCDMSLMLNYKAIYQTAQGIAGTLGSKIQLSASPGISTERDDEITTKPLDFDEVAMFNPTGGYGNAILPAVLIIIIQQTLLLSIGLAAGTARERNKYGTLLPHDKHYNGVFRIVFGKALPYVMTYAVLAAYLTLVVPHLFGFTTLATGKTLIAILTPYILACTFFGMFLSCLVRYRENVMLLVVFTSLIFLFLSGISWPQSSIPGFWKAISYLFPSTFGVQGFLKTSSMGASLEDVGVEYSALWIQALAYFLLACLVYRVQIIMKVRAVKERTEKLNRQKLENQ